VVLNLDCTFFGRGYGIIIARAAGQKKNLYWKEVDTENREVYQELRKCLEGAGFTIQAIVIDIKPGIKEVFSDVVVQACQFHQQQIITPVLDHQAQDPSWDRTQANLRLTDHIGRRIIYNTTGRMA